MGTDLQRMAHRKLLILDAAEVIGDHEGRIMTRKRAHAPIHPGEILLEEFLASLGITQYRLAATIGVPARRINEIVHGTRSITPDTALRLSRALGTSDRFWLNLQNRYDLDIATEKNGDQLDRIPSLLTA